MEKYENDTESRTNELANLKSDKDKDLRTLQELARTYDDYEVPLLNFIPFLNHLSSAL